MRGVCTSGCDHSTNTYHNPSRCGFFFFVGPAWSIFFNSGKHERDENRRQKFSVQTPKTDCGKKHKRPPYAGEERRTGEGREGVAKGRGEKE